MFLHPPYYERKCRGACSAYAYPLAESTVLIAHAPAYTMPADASPRTTPRFAAPVPTLGSLKSTPTPRGQLTGLVARHRGSLLFPLLISGDSVGLTIAILRLLLHATIFAGLKRFYDMPMCFVIQLELGFVTGIAAAGVYEPIVRPLHILIPALPIATYPPETWANLGHAAHRYVLHRDISSTAKQQYGAQTRISPPGSRLP
ncbi:hypothetical protein B0H14DRAFT_3452317 [Mycena olivaceomarginata]|nr:hypothetical protein B0H14DRAFT_3452317 [Mycena olivaceomarginata]